MHKCPIMFMLLISILVMQPLVRADRGGIPLTLGVSVYEPGQKAIIAWNGHQEALILSTDASASQETLVLEIMPLPSKPVIEQASFSSFTAIQDMIWQEGLNRYVYNTKEAASSGSIEILFHQNIGAHNITVVLADNAVDLVDWANTFLSDSGAARNITLQNFQAVIHDYMNRGFRHFALDLVTLQPEERSMDPILYRFNSTTLYYPLLITTPVGGNGNIILFTITTEKLETNYWPLTLCYYKTPNGNWQPIQFTLSKGDMSRVDLRIGELMPDGSWLTVLKYEGDLGILNSDLMVSQLTLSHDTSPTPSITINLPIDTVASIFVLGAVSSLTGVAVAFLIIRASRKK
jgi:hypothetical protein